MRERNIFAFRKIFRASLPSENAEDEVNHKIQLGSQMKETDMSIFLVFFIRRLRR